MDRIDLKDFFCENCSLQFGNKIVYDLHISLVHENQIKSHPEDQLQSIKIDHDFAVKYQEIGMVESHSNTVLKIEKKIKDKCKCPFDIITIYTLSIFYKQRL